MYGITDKAGIVVLKQLDPNRLNFLKMVAFNKYPCSNVEETIRIWKRLTSKVNQRCRVMRHRKKLYAK